MEAGSKLTKAIESLNWSLSERDTFAQLTRHNNCEKFRDHSQIPLLWNLIGMIRVSQQQYLVIYVVLPNTHTWTCPTEFTDCLEYNHTHTLVTLLFVYLSENAALLLMPAVNDDYILMLLRAYSNVHLKLTVPPQKQTTYKLI